MRSVLSSDGNSRTWRAGLPARAVGSTADQRTAPDRASSARKPIRVWTTIMSGPACSTSSAVASEAAVTRRCIRPPSPFFWGSVCSNSPSFAQRCSPVARSYSATTGGPAARRPWTSRVPLCGSTRRVTICARLRRRESNTVAPVTGSKINNRPGRAASTRSDPSIMRTLSAGNPPSSGFSHTVWPRSISTPASAASVETRSAPAGRGRYTVEQEVGEGGMATVYRARDLKHDRLVAIKVLKPALGEALGSDRFLREIKLTAQLSHPHILPLLDSGEVGGRLYYVMPYVAGE